MGLISRFPYFLRVVLHLPVSRVATSKRENQSRLEHGMFYMRFVASFGLISMGGRTYQLNRDGQIPQSSRSCPASSQDTLLRSFRSRNAYKSTQIQVFSLILARFAL